MRNPYVGPVVHLTPSLVEEWQWCRRAYRNRHLLQLPVLDAGVRPMTSVGLDVHRLLEVVHRRGLCGDSPAVATLVADAGLRPELLMPYLSRHFQLCSPSGTGWSDHELQLARFRRRAEPMWLATGKLDAVWERRHVLEARDYKTGGCSLEQVGDDLAARMQAYLLAPLAAERGLGVRIVYEYLSPDVSDGPEPFEPDDDDLSAIEAELDQLAGAIAAETAFEGCGHAATCGRCGYREICPVAI